MELIKLTDKIFYCPHETESDRPLLAYVRGDRYALAVDAGYSRRHARAFYAALETCGFRPPDFTVLTHWHFDHTLGMCAAAGLTVACEKTARYLESARQRFACPANVERLRRNDRFFAGEYADEAPQVALPSVRFRSELQIDLGGITAKMFLTEAPHTDDSVCVFTPQEETLFLGDSVCEDVYNGGYLDRAKLRSLTETIRNIPCRHCVLSHEPPLPKEELLASLQEECDP